MTTLVRISNRIDKRIASQTDAIEKAQKQLSENYLEAFKWGAGEVIYLNIKLNNDLQFLKANLDTGREGFESYLKILCKNLLSQIMRVTPGNNITNDSHGITRRLDDQAAKILYEFVDDLQLMLSED